MHFNRAQAFKFLEYYGESVIEFTRANEIDRTLNGMREAEAVTQFLFNLTGKISSKCEYRGKKLHGLIKTIPAVLKGSPFGGNCQIAAINELVSGTNKNVILSCKLMMNLKGNVDEVPMVFVATDFRGKFFAVSIYNSSK